MKVLSAESQAIASRVLSLPCARRPLEALRRLLFSRTSAKTSTGAADEWAPSPEDRALLADTGANDRLAVALADLRPWLDEQEIRGQKAA